MMAEPMVEIVEYTDPLCSIAWGTEPIKRRLLWRFGDRVSWRAVMAGLCRDNSKAEIFDPWDPYEAGQTYVKIWKRVTTITGMPYPEDLRYMALTTDPPCLLVKAAEKQGAKVADRVLRRFREAVFLYGTPMDAIEQASTALARVEGLDLEALLRDARTDAVQAAYLSDWEETRRPNDYVRELARTGAHQLAGPMRESEGHERYDLPTFIFKGPEGERTVPGFRPYEEYEEALVAVAPGIATDPPADPSAEEALSRWPTMTAKELEVLCGTADQNPSNADGFDCCGSKVWLRGEEATYWRERKSRAANESA